MKNLPLIVLFLLLSGCTVVLLEPDEVEYDPDLLSGSAIFGEEILSSESPDPDVLGLTPEMEVFVADIRESRLTVVRFRQLLDKLRETGFFENVYDPNVTTTASETFEAKVGNCISYTSLFIALARAAELEVSYQLVALDQPTFDADGGVLIRNNHINLVVDGARFHRNRSRGHTIDFNLVDPDPQAHVIKISDEHAKSLFLANLSVDEMLKGNERRAFSYLRSALELAPQNVDLWINLGAFYSRHQRHTKALASYEIARSLDSRHSIVLSGLERTHRYLGNNEAADRLAGQVRRYRQRNPYYHFAMAQAAYEEDEFEESLMFISKAVSMKRRNPRFHYLKGLVEYRLGDERGAARSLERAERFGRFDDLERRYGRLKIAYADPGSV